MKLSSFLHFAAFGVRTILLREKKPILGTVIVTDRCNLKCRHCSVHDLTSVDHPYEQIRREMELLYHMGVRILFFCGGETFLWHDGARTVRDLVVEAKKMGFLLVNVVTNGTFPIDLPEADLILYYGASELNYVSYVHGRDMGEDKTLIGRKFRHFRQYLLLYGDQPDQQRRSPGCLSGGAGDQKCAGGLL